MQKNYSIKTFVKRPARISKKQKENYEKLFPKYCIKLQNDFLSFGEIFQNENPTVIEIGFGTGEATAKIALDNRELNYLAIDVFHAGVAKLLTKIEEKNIENIRIIEDDAIEVLKQMILPNSVSGFHIFFPDPWQKKRHHKRRLMQEDKITLLAEKLIPGGYIYFVSDWAEYAESALLELNKVPSLKNKFAPKQTWRPETSFEKKALIAGRKIYELIFEKVQ